MTEMEIDLERDTLREKIKFETEFLKLTEK
jgi:hypothetical protein